MIGNRVLILMSAAAVFCVATTIQAAVYYDRTATISNPISTYDAFGLLQNQYGHSNTSLKWEAYVDDLTYTTQSGSESQTFDSAPAASTAGWAANAGATASPNNFGYASSNNAGGASTGEAGGIIARASASRGQYVDTTIGTVDMTTDSLFASGTLWIDGSAADNSFFLGWLKNTDPASDSALGFIFTEPASTQPSDGARIAIRMKGEGGTQTEAQELVNGISGKQLYWEFSYNASTGEMSGYIADIPEPASMLLLGLGATLILRRKN